jgi:hypothetical protein
LPALLYQQLRRQSQRNDGDSRPWGRLQAELREQHRRLFYAIAGSGLLISAAITLAAPAAPGLLGVPALTWVLAGIGSALLLVAWPRRSV